MRRNANIYCEVVGYASYGDAFHLTRPREDGEGGYRTMAKCMVDAGVTPYDVNFVNCHATSTETGDLSELAALKNLFGNMRYKDFEYFKESILNYEYDLNLSEEIVDKERLKLIIINANKTHIGHLLAAAGSVESIFTILCMKNNKVLSNMNTEKPISSFFNFQYDKENEVKFMYGLKNSFAFGGVNTSVLFKKYQ